MSNRNYYIIIFILLTTYLVNGCLAIPRLSITADEGDHLNYAIRLLKFQPEKVKPFDDASTMPVSALNALPRAVEQVLQPGIQKNDWGRGDVMNGRYITLFVCLLTGLFILQWSAQLFGRQAGLFSLFLFVFCPNLTANNWLVSTDAYAALATIATGYFFWRFAHKSGWKNFIYFSICLGIAQVTKQSLVLLFFFFGVSGILLLISRGTLRINWLVNFKRLLVLGLIVLFIINLAFLFNGSFRSLNEYHFYSRSFQGFQNGWLSHLPIPLPAPFVEGFDLVKYMLGLGSGHIETSPRSYLFGQYFTGRGVWYYYPSLFLFKTPLFVLVSLLFAAIYIVKRHFSDLWKLRALPVWLGLFFIGAVMFLNTSQHSLRHVLMVYPLLYVSLGALTRVKIYWRKYILVTGVCYSLISFYSYFPNMIAYTNELLWNKTRVYRVMGSSNIDFDQGVFYINRYLRDHPTVQWAGEQPATGDFVIRINNYLDLRNTGKYSWIRKLQPDTHIQHCYLLFHVTEEKLQKARIH